MVGRMTPGDNHSAYTPFANDASEHSAPKQRRPEHGIDRASPDTSKFDAAPEATERQGRDKTRHRLWGCSKLRRQPLLSPRILSHNHRRVAHPGEVRHRRFHFPPSQSGIRGFSPGRPDGPDIPASRPGATSPHRPFCTSAPPVRRRTDLAQTAPPSALAG